MNNVFIDRMSHLGLNFRYVDYLRLVAEWQIGSLLPKQGDIFLIGFYSKCWNRIRN